MRARLFFVSLNRAAGNAKQFKVFVQQDPRARPLFTIDYPYVAAYQIRPAEKFLGMAFRKEEIDFWQYLANTRNP
jgi:hypothetical protein